MVNAHILFYLVACSLTILAAAVPRSLSASRRLYLASSRTPGGSQLSRPGEKPSTSTDDLPRSASLENLDVQRTNVLSSNSPDVTGQQRMVLTTLEYVSSGSVLMTLYVMKWSRFCVGVSESIKTVPEIK
jgi:hypothetical protein